MNQLYQYRDRTLRNSYDKVVSTQMAIKNALANYNNINLPIIESYKLDGWVLAPDALRFLSAIVSSLKPKHILEFGSGLSTRVLEKASTELLSSCCISSVDHDPEYGGVTFQEYSVQPEKDCAVKIQIAPIVARQYGGKWLPVYMMQPQKFASKQPFDLVVIDGPPATLGGREGTLYQAMDFLRCGTLVILDDASRKDEKRAVSNWQDNLGDAIEVIWLDGFTRGMVAIIIREPVRGSDLMLHRLYLIRKEIETYIGQEEPFILVDEDFWRNNIGTDYNIIPFLEQDGQYWGPPSDNNTAINELERLRQSGAGIIVFGPSAFWWLDYYAEFHSYLLSEFSCILKNDRFVVFDLHQ